MASNRMQAEQARRRAQEKFSKAEKREKDHLNEKNKAIAEMASKTARLRALRLAKETADKEAADARAAEKPPAKKRTGNPAAKKHT